MFLEVIFVLFLAGEVNSFYDGQQYITETFNFLLGPPLNIQYEASTNYYRVDKCYNSGVLSRGIYYQLTLPVMFKIENDRIVLHAFLDNDCTIPDIEWDEWTWINRTIGEEYEFVDDTFGFPDSVEVFGIPVNITGIKKWDLLVGDVPTMPTGDTIVKMSYSFEDEEACTGPRQFMHISTNVCARNFVAFGSYYSLGDMVYLACDEDAIWVRIYQDLDCSEEEFIHGYNVNLDFFRLVSLYVEDFEPCFMWRSLGTMISTECVESYDTELEEYLSGGKDSSAKFAVTEFYYRNDEQKCLGEPTLKYASMLDECSGNQRQFRSEGTAVIVVFQVDDFDCSMDPVAVHLIHSDLLQLENDPDCIDMWALITSNYFTKIVLVDSYDLNEYSSNVAIISDINCEDIDYELVQTYRTNPVRQVSFAHDDFCLSEENLFSFVGFNSFKGYCAHGKLYMKNYTVKGCEKIFEMVETDSHHGFCWDPLYITCLSYECFGKEQFDKEVCSGYGVCVAIDKCECENGYLGGQCEIALSSLWFIPVLCVLCTGLGSVVIFVIVIVIVIFSRIIKQKNELEEFNDIEDIEILVQESQINKGKSDTLPRAIRTKRETFGIEKETLVLQKEIGSGGSGSMVYLATWNGKPVAYKVFCIDEYQEQHKFDEFEKELEFAFELRHPSILAFYGATFQPPGRIGIVMELAGKGSMSSFVQMQMLQNDGISLKERIRLLVEVATGMKYLKERDIIHRDLKSENVLVTDSLSAKIMDFGLSRKVTRNQNEEELTKRIGTSFYMAPEVNFRKDYNYKVDIFSFSIVMWELFYINFLPYGRNWREQGLLELRVAKENDFRPVIAEEDSKEHPLFCKIMKQCWNFEPDDRPEWETIIKGLKEMSSHLKDKGIEVSQSTDFEGDKENEIIRLKEVLRKKEVEIANLLANMKNEKNEAGMLEVQRSKLTEEKTREVGSIPKENI